MKHCVNTLRVYTYHTFYIPMKKICTSRIDIVQPTIVLELKFSLHTHFSFFNNRCTFISTKPLFSFLWRLLVCKDNRQYRTHARVLTLNSHYLTRARVLTLNSKYHSRARVLTLNSHYFTRGHNSSPWALCAQVS